MEVVRDQADNCIIICSIENLDPMGVHTGDSITVAPAQTLTDKEYQIMRDASIAVLREIGVDTGGSNVQFAINPDGRPHGGDRDEPARVALLGARLEGDRLPDRQGRGQARGRLHAGRAHERDHRRRDAGLVRADHRLRRHQDAALRVREIPAGERPPDHADEIGGRGDGDRPHLPGVVPEGAARPGDRRRRPRPADHRPRDARDASSASPGPERIWYVGDAFGSGFTLEEIHRLTHIDPWFLAQIEDLVRPGDGAGRPERSTTSTRTRCARSSARASPTGASPRCSTRARTRCASAATRSASARCTSAWTPAPPNSRPTPPTCTRPTRRSARPTPTDAQEDHGARRRAEPHRPGHRVRLLLRARRARAARGRLRDHHGQLQPGDRLDRLRHLRPPVLRAADARGRARDRGQGEALRRDRAVRRADAAEARARPGGERRADHRHQRRT